MVIRYLTRAAALLPLGMLISYAGACGHEHDSPSLPADVIIEGDATDEGFSAFERAPETADAARAPVLTAPKEGSTIPDTEPLAFTWKATPLAFTTPRHPIHHVAYPPSFGPMREAFAHGIPMNGRAFVLTIRADDRTVLRVFTTRLIYQPDAAARAKLKEATGSLSATIASASYDNNNIVQGSGPFLGNTVRFNVAK